jgi:hypothetical protein
MENSSCHQCGKNPWVGNRYAAYHELSKYELMCHICQSQENDKREKTEAKNREICRWFSHKWGEQLLHSSGYGLVRYCQRAGCKAEKIFYCYDC